MPNPAQGESDLHDQAEELLPWYATGQLDAADRSLVESHLASCARCQRQLSVERRLVDEFQSFSPEVDSGWSRLRNRIERPVPSRPSWIAQAAADLRRIFTRPAVAALALAQVAILAFAAWFLPLATQPAYQALGSSEAPPTANVIVMFRPETRVADLRSALSASGASLVGGPTSAGAYLVHVPANARDSALAKLRADDDVIMAQPIDASVQ